MDLSDLVIKCKAGDAGAFNELYKLYNKKALRTVYLVSGRKEIADDAVQEAFIQCFLSIKNLRKPEKFNCWFYSILLRNIWKVKSKNKPALSIEDVHESYDRNNTQETIEEAYEAREVHDIIKRSIDKLSLPMKTAVILYYYNDMSVSDISSVLGCFEGTVKSRLHNARELIKKDLAKHNKGILDEKVFQERECGNHG